MAKAKSKRKRKRQPAKKRAPAKKRTPAPASRTPPTGPEFTDAELVVRRRALAASGKDREEWSKADANAVQKWGEIREEKERWLHYATIPQKHLVQMLSGGVTARVLIDAANNHGMPRSSGPKNAVLYDFSDFLPWLWRMAFDRRRGPDPRDELAIERERVRLENDKIDLAVKQGKYVHGETLIGLVQRWAELHRNKDATFQRMIEKGKVKPDDVHTLATQTQEACDRLVQEMLDIIANEDDA